MKNFWLIFLLCLFPILLQAQDDRDMMDKLLSEDQSGLEAIAMYPVEIRKSILEASIHPEVLVRMQALQKQTSDQFKNILGMLNRDDQERIWEITRYPGLVAKISEGGKKTNAELEAIAQDFPEGIRASAIDYGRREYNVIKEIHQLNLVNEKAFNAVLAPYPSATSNAYLELLDHPEILTILSDNMNMTVILGDLYKRNPAYVIQQTDSISLALAENNAKELEDWKKSLEEDPEALKELQEAAGEYAREQGYTADEYTQPVTQVTEVRYVYQPYPYWYGYPWWYDYNSYYYNDYWYSGPTVYVRPPYGYNSWWYVYPRWYPRPWWYDWGFYYGPGNQIIVWNLPSYHFCWWHFNVSHHHYHYPHLSNHFVSWHQHHRNSTSSLGRAVRTWEEQNRAQLPANLLNDDPGRVERFREYGHMETSLANYNQSRPGREVGRAEYLEKHEKSYPNLARPTGTLQAQPATPARPSTPATTPTRTPVLKDPTGTSRPKTEPTRTPIRSTPPKIETATPRSTQQINRAKDYHQGTWEQNNPRPTRVPVRVTPPTRTPSNAPVRTPTRSSTPVKSNVKSRR